MTLGRFRLRSLRTLIDVLADETALQVFEPAADDQVDGERSALARLEQVVEDARDYAAHAKALNTLNAYRIDWADFSEWCALYRLECLPATARTVALYLTNLAGCRYGRTRRSRTRPSTDPRRRNYRSLLVRQRWQIGQIA